jgi:quercetin dioxygenase-like cupin family protein
MGYRVIDPESVEPTPDRPCVQRAVGDEAGLENVALNLYEVAPGEQIPLAYHYHDDQEEVFHVLSGELHVETPEDGESTSRRASSDGELVVPEGHLFVAEPDSPHRAFVPEDADGPVRALALGAPPTDDVHPYEP